MFFNSLSTSYSDGKVAAAMMTVPVLVAFIFTQKQFVQGISMTGLK